MENPEYKYDVAFSFLAEDEGLATELNDLIQDRFQTFLYAKSQEIVAGTDGEETFNAVFGKEARSVVVLYREGWGESPWTRIEETAIRNRAFEQGYDFVKFIPLDDIPSVPKWLPRTQIWIGLKRCGTRGAASVIEARIEELGGEPSEETVTNMATRLDRSLKFQEKRENFLHSVEGVNTANKEFEALYEELEKLIKAIKTSVSSFSIQLRRTRCQIVVLSLGRGLSIDWQCHYANSLRNAQLDVTLWRGHPPFVGQAFLEKPKKLRTERFIFDLLPSEQCCWMSSGQEARPYTTEDLASFALKSCMNQDERRRGPMVY